jgi:NADH-quinone oxidoreductase subunit N
VGFSFKIALVPFHMWTPDVYEGAPTPITAYMSVAVKASVLAALARFFWMALPDVQSYWMPALWVLSALTMTFGNVVALMQDNVKRMLSYSSIAHAGYILMALVAYSNDSLTAMLIYLLSYTFVNVGAFGVVVLLQNQYNIGERTTDFGGMGFHHPVLAAVMALFLFSLTGIPPTAGFVAKFFVFSAAVQAGYIGLVVLGVLNSAVAAYYYLRLVVIMYSGAMEETETSKDLLRTPACTVGALSLSAWATLQIGILPGALWNWAKHSVSALM